MEISDSIFPRMSDSPETMALCDSTECPTLFGVAATWAQSFDEEGTIDTGLALSLRVSKQLFPGAK